jgi:hypothetical protein
MFLIQAYALTMKIKVLTLTLILIVCGFAPANAAAVTEKIVVNKKTVLTFSLANSVTLNTSGCEEVYIKYTIDKSYYFPNAYVMFGLYSAENNEAQSIYVQPGNGKGDQGKDAWTGNKEMIFCGKAKTYINDYGDKVEAPAFSKGKYTFTARFTILKPKLSTVQSKKITFTVK